MLVVYLATSRNAPRSYHSSMPVSNTVDPARALFSPAKRSSWRRRTETPILSAFMRSPPVHRLKYLITYCPISEIGVWVRDASVLYSLFPHFCPSDPRSALDDHPRHHTAAASALLKHGLFAASARPPTRFWRRALGSQIWSTVSCILRRTLSAFLGTAGGVQLRRKETRYAHARRTPRVMTRIKDQSVKMVTAASLHRSKRESTRAYSCLL